MKIFEIRDRMTFIPALAFKLDPKNEAEVFLAAKAGYSGHIDMQKTYVFLMPISGGHGYFSSDVYEHRNGGRTMAVAHKYIEENYETLEHGALVDVQFILGETSQPCESEFKMFGW